MIIPAYVLAALWKATAMQAQRPGVFTVVPPLKVAMRQLIVVFGNLLGPPNGVLEVVCAGRPSIRGAQESKHGVLLQRFGYLIFAHFTVREHEARVLCTPLAATKIVED